MKAMVVGFVFRVDTREVLLVQKLKPEWQKGLWNGIGGKIEPGELPREAIIREFDEELKGTFISGSNNWKHMITLVCSTGVVFFYRYPDLLLTVTDDHPKTNDVDENLVWHPIDNLPKEVMVNLKWIVPFCYHQKLEAPIFVHEDMWLYRDKDPEYLKRAGLR